MVQEDGTQKLKYSGLFNCLKTVWTEEGYQKLFLGGIHPRFMFNMVNGVLFLFIYDRFIVKLNSQYMSKEESFLSM